MQFRAHRVDTEAEAFIGPVKSRLTVPSGLSLGETKRHLQNHGQRVSS